jgi:hypothetical protein
LASFATVPQAGNGRALGAGDGKLLLREWWKVRPTRYDAHVAIKQR